MMWRTHNSLFSFSGVARRILSHNKAVTATPKTTIKTKAPPSGNRGS